MVRTLTRRGHRTTDFSATVGSPASQWTPAPVSWRALATGRRHRGGEVLGRSAMVVRIRWVVSGGEMGGALVRCHHRGTRHDARCLSRCSENSHGWLSNQTASEGDDSTVFSGLLVRAGKKQSKATSPALVPPRPRWSWLSATPTDGSRHHVHRHDQRVPHPPPCQPSHHPRHARLHCGERVANERFPDYADCAST